MENNNIEQFGPVGLNAAPTQERNKDFEEKVLEKLDIIIANQNKTLSSSNTEKVEEVVSEEEKLEDTQVVDVVDTKTEEVPTEIVEPAVDNSISVEPTQENIATEEVLAEPEKEFSTVTVDSISNEDILAETREEPKNDFIDIDSLLNEDTNKVIPYEEPKVEEIKEVPTESEKTIEKPIEVPETPVIEPVAPVVQAPTEVVTEPVVEASPVVTPVTPVAPAPVVEAAPVTPIVTSEQTIEPSKEETQVVSAPVVDQSVPKGFKDVTREYVGMTLPETSINTEGTAQRVMLVDSNEVLLNKENQASKALVNNPAA